MHHGMEKLHSLTARRYAEHLIYINAYLASFPGETLTDKIGVTELNEIILNNMTNIWSKQAYLQGFDCEYITLQISISMFERMDISESIYKGVVEPSYKKTTWADTNHGIHSRKKRGESASSWNLPDMSESAGNLRKRHVDIPSGKLKTCLIHVP